MFSEENHSVPTKHKSQILFRIHFLSLVFHPFSTTTALRQVCPLPLDPWGSTWKRSPRRWKGNLSAPSYVPQNPRSAAPKREKTYAVDNASDGCHSCNA